MSLIEKTLDGIRQMIGESIALGKDPMDWILFFAEFSEEYGRL